MALVAVAVFTFGGCATLVRKPAADKVKSVAIVSVHSNSVIYNLSGGGGMTSGLAALKALTSDSSSSARSGGTRVVEAAYQVFSQKLGEVPGWTVMALKDLEASADFKAWTAQVRASNAGGLGGLAELNESNWTVHPSLARLQLSSGDQINSTQKALLTDIAKKLKVDAVVVLGVDVAYKNYTSFGGTGTAVASVAAGLKVITSDGEFAVVGEDAGKDRGLRFDSDTTTGVVMGNIDFNDKVEGMLREAFLKAASDYRQRIEQGLKAK